MIRHVFFWALTTLLIGGGLAADQETREQIFEKAKGYARDESRELEELARWCFKQDCRPLGYAVLEEARQASKDNSSVLKALKNRDDEGSAEIPPVDVQEAYIQKRRGLGAEYARKWAKIVGWSKKEKGLDQLEKDARTRFFRNMTRTVGILHTAPQISEKERQARRNLEETLRASLPGVLRDVEEALGLGLDPGKGLTVHVMPGEAMEGEFAYDASREPHVIRAYLGCWTTRPKIRLTMTRVFAEVVALQEAGHDLWLKQPLWFRAGLGPHVAGTGVAHFEAAREARGGEVEPVLDDLTGDGVMDLQALAMAHVAFTWIEERTEKRFRSFLREAITGSQGVEGALRKYKLPRGESLNEALKAYAIKRIWPDPR